MLTTSYLGARFQYDLDVGGGVLKVESLDHFGESELFVYIPSQASIVFAQDARTAAAAH